VVTVHQDTHEWFVRVHLPGQDGADEYGMGENIKNAQAARQQAAKVLQRVPGFRRWAAENIDSLRDQMQA